MHASDEPAPQSLTLPMPRWPFLWPALLVPAYLINPAFHLTRSWNGPLRFRLLGILLVVASLVCGALLSVGALASHHWRELRIERGCIFLKPAFQVPHWARWCYNPGQSRTFKEGFLEFSLDQASLEWVGEDPSAARPSRDGCAPGARPGCRAQSPNG